MSFLISAAAFAPQIPDGSAPSEIVYFPEGIHQISATVDGKPGKLTVRIPAEKGPQIAAALQSALEKRRAANVRPWFDFEHKRGVASALPKAFRYEPGRGVMCALEWTGAGKAAVEGRDFSYFSPEFLVGDDGTPNGLPERGPLGALVNEPAFREIPRIAAADTGDTRDLERVFASDSGAYLAYLKTLEGGASPGRVAVSAQPSVSTGAVVSAQEELARIAQGLVEAGEAPTLEDGLVVAVERNPALYKASFSEKVRPEIQKEIEEMVAALEPSAHEKLRDIADEIYLRGETDNESDAMVLAIQRNPLLYQERRDAQDEQMARVGHLQPREQVAASDFETKARNLVAAGEVETVEEAFGIVAASDPALYREYLATLA